MSTRIALHHVTEYQYDRPVNLLPHVLRLRPAPHCRTSIHSYSLRVEPKSHFLNWQQDPYGNFLARLAFSEPTERLRIEVDLIADLANINPFDFFVDGYAQAVPFAYDQALERELAPYLQAEPAGKLLGEVIAGRRRSGERTIDFLVELNRFLRGRIGYIVRMEPGIQACEETLERGSGSCRDTAWLLVQLLRHLGLAARFASGYLIQLKPDRKPLDGPPGPEMDFSDLHAWAEVYLPGAGWIGLDPTSGLFTGEGHIPLACAAAPVTASPISGSYLWSRQDGETHGAACREEFHVRMSVDRMDGEPAPSRPYAPEEWQAIDDLGRRIDGALDADGVRLTLGGEPTFIAIDGRDAPEWNTAALGPEKRRLAGELLRRLRDRFAPGGVLHLGQGKWYPGELLPRWALGCYWRRDGKPIWRDATLLAADGQGPGCGEAEARRFLMALARRLDVDAACIQPAYEDAWYYLWRERNLPANVDPFDSRLDDAEERARLAAIFERGLAAAAGFVLPLRPACSGNGNGNVHGNSPGNGNPNGNGNGQRRWQSAPWRMRRERLYLLPGSSPMGYRLPLDALPWEAAGAREHTVERDPMAPRGELPDHSAQRRLEPSRRHFTPALAAACPPAAGLQGISPKVRTALCAEPREGRLHLFLPPVGAIEDYLDLIAAIEDTASELRFPVVLEGYPPPFDPRIRHFQVTPDPGVIEVNIQPAASWKELVENTTILYEEARLTRLTAEKFHLDGRRAGTGGGNHIVIGGPSPAESPALRRPDLLGSLVAYWHNHPALSYLFSGLFIGPTSQAPRPDEARNDSIYELELAFRQLPAPASGGWMPPLWTADRLFRHLLTDMTGNTHRAEFCIDKLYAPESPDGRRGLVELRSFEMPPHAEMSLAQQLLIRALIAWFWKTPYRRRPARWGTELHDRFLLPHFIWLDFQEVIEDLRQAGFPVQEGWFAPHREFRFPLIGSVSSRGIHLELRPALEPWLVLGEEPGGGGQARYVDSSLERLQVHVKGLVDGRHWVSCNRRRVPLHPTGAAGEFVAGVRFRAWQPPSCLHPSIPVHAPLTFDIFDLWRERSIGGCTYHVSHPGGRAFETLPVNEAEAEGRWKARFWPFGHTPGPDAPPPPEHRPEFPLTLDLRQPGPASAFMADRKP